MLGAAANAAVCTVSSSESALFDVPDDPVLLDEDEVDAVFLVLADFTTGALTTLLAFGVGLVVHCQMPFANTHA